MIDENRELLRQVIETEIKDLKNWEEGSLEKSRAIDDIAKLYKLKIEEDKNQLEFEERARTYEFEKSLKTKEMVFRIREILIKYGVEIGLGAAWMIFKAVWMHRGFKFEEDGTLTSTVFRTLYNGFNKQK